MFGRGYNNVVSKEVILSLTSQESILNHYLGVKKLPALINAPYRSDENPSLSIDTNNQDIIWYDYGLKIGGDLFSLLKKIYNLNFQRLLEKIYDDMNLFNSSPIYDPTKRHNKKGGVNYVVEVKVRDVEAFDHAYWRQYGVLNFTRWNIFPISMFKYTNVSTGSFNVIKADKYSYAFYENQNGRHSIKIYQPYNKGKYKWFSAHSKDVLDLLTFLPKTGNNLILTSSRKDAINIWNNFDIPSISPQGEGYILSDYIMADLKSKFKNIHVLYDNDFTKSFNPGQTHANILCDKYQLSNIVIPSEIGCKDPSDLYKTNKKLYQEVMKDILPITL